MPLSEHDLTVHSGEITLFGATNFRNQMRKFGIKTEDRRRHMYVIGKTGTGKSTLLENMMYQDLHNGHGLALVDPHGDFAERIIGFTPVERLSDIIYINPADLAYPVGFNVLEWEKEEQKFLIGAGLMGVFKKIWPDVWSPRMEHILNNCILALLDYPNSTLLGINRILIDRDYRKIVINAVKDPVVKSFWLHEFERWEPKFQKEAIAPIQNKVGQFLASTLIRNIVAQTKSTFDIRQAMDQGRILIINLSKGRIGEDASKLLGGMLITKIQLAAMERVDIPEKERRDFYLYVDEFQNFATEAFANILSEARKYRLNLIVAHQYIEQLEEEVAAAVFGNVGTLVIFRVGADDAKFLEPEFEPEFLKEDLVNLPVAQVYVKLMIDGVTSKPFSAHTLPPIGVPVPENIERVIAASREHYAVARTEVERKITEWSESYVDEAAIKAAPKPLNTAPASTNLLSSKDLLKAPLPPPLSESNRAPAPRDERRGGSDRRGSAGSFSDRRGPPPQNPRPVVAKKVDGGAPVPFSGKPRIIKDVPADKAVPVTGAGIGGNERRSERKDDRKDFKPIKPINGPKISEISFGNLNQDNGGGQSTPKNDKN